MSTVNLLTYYRAAAGTGGAPTLWMDSAYDSRVTLSAPNATGFTLHDQVLTATVPATVNAASLRVVETVSTGLDNPQAWRYAIGTSINRTRFLPCSLSGTTLTFKVLGQWANGVTRTFAVYWDSTAALSAVTYGHLGGNVQSWTYTVGGTLTVGDVYKLVIGGVGGTPYTYTAIGGDTTTTIAQALKAQVSASLATVSGAAAALTITQADYTNCTFSVTSTGSTLATGTITIVKPGYFGLSRNGPDTDIYTATAKLAGAPFGNPVSGAQTRVAWGKTTTRCIRAMRWDKNSGGTKIMNDATISSLTNKQAAIALVGAMTGDSTEWTAAYTATYSHKIVTGRKSDDTGAATLNKYVDVWRVNLVYTCAVAYAPTTVASNATTGSGHEILTVASLDATFGGNVTAAAGNKVLNWYADTATGTVTSYTNPVDLSALSTSGGHILGTSGNANSVALLVNSCVLANFSPATPNAYWSTQGNNFAVLGYRGTASGTNIPVGATITVDAWMVFGDTNQATTTGDYLLPDEAVSVLRGLAATTPAVTVSTTTERYSSGSVAASARAASTALLTGTQWFADNALSKGGKAGNIAFAYDLVTTTALPIPDDDDGSYGVAHLLHGLCLRYLRTHEAAVITHIERCVQFFINISAAGVAAYGSWWLGAIPYWYASGAVTKTGSEGGLVSNGADPAISTAPPSATKVYATGDVRALTSVDQMHMTAHGLYAYLYLLRNESAVTANTTLVTNAKALLAQMATFEAGNGALATSAQICGNLSRIVQGLTPTRNNGINATLLNTDSGATLANPYYGIFWGTWQNSNTDVITYDPSANVTIDNFFRAVFSNDSVASGVKRWLNGQALDLVAGDHGHRSSGAVVTADTTWGVIGEYPKGWGGRGGSTGVDLKYTAARTGDDHWIRINASSRDHFNGRHAQRLVVFCLAALMDPTTVLTIETESPGRTVAITTLIDQTVSELASHMIEETTGASRWGVGGWIGGGNNTTPTTQNIPKVVDSAFTGYLMMAVELALLVKAGASYTSYYPIGAW